jgi:O-antigen/teichoic acid export membrane protein
MAGGSLLTPISIDSSSAQISWATRLRHILGLDRAIAFTVLARGWSGLAGLVTVVLIARFLSPSEQGFYFTFGSLVAMQLVFELGFSVVILQLATHECAHLRLSSDGVVDGSAVAHSRLASVLQKSVRWYTVAAVLMVAFLIPAGIHFFSVHQAGTRVAWLVPWSLLVVAAGFTFQIDPIFSFLEGCGYISNVAHTRFWQAVCGSVLAWATLVTHHGLFAPAMLICGQAIVGLVFLVSRRRLLLSLLRWDAGIDRIDWGREVWPFQWRIAVSYSCGFFIFQLFNPVLFAFWGPVVAGQMGMSLSMGNMLASVAIAWVNTKSAPFGVMIARREYGKLDRIFAAAVTQATVLCLSGAVILWTTCFYLNVHGFAFAHRMLAPLPFGLLLLAVVCNQVVAAEAIYLRAHKQEKFLINSLVGAVLMGLSTYFLGRNYAALGVTSGYLACVIIGLGMGTWTFVKYRRQWHGA